MLYTLSLYSEVYQLFFSETGDWGEYTSDKGLLPKYTADSFFFFNFLFIFIYLFLAALGLRCCTWAFSSCGEWGPLFVAVHRLLIAVSSLVAEHGL